MKIIVFYLCFFQFVVSYNQRQDDLSTYYKCVNLAELSIIDNQLDIAKINYELAFKTGIGFPIDKYNAFRVSYFRKDTLRSIAYFNDLRALGQDKEKFLLFFFKKDTIPNDPYMNFVTKDIDDYSYNISNMRAIAKKLDTIYDMDQQCRSRNLSHKEFDACDKVVLQKMYDFIDIYGFPDYKKVGLMERIVKQAINTNTFDFLLWHARGKVTERIYSIGIENVNKGLYDARKFSRGYAYEGSKYQILIPKDPITKEQLKQINLKRSEIYLEPLEDFIRKIEYHSKNGKYVRGYCFVDPFLFAFSSRRTLIVSE